MPENRETIRARVARWRSNPGNRRRERERARIRTYSVTPAVMASMARRQGKRCAICGARVPLVLDHDHNTGLVRGLLCSNCNVMLGYAQDDPVRLRKAAEYVESGPTVTVTRQV